MIDFESRRRSSMNRYFVFLLATAATLYGAVAEAKLNVIASTPTLAALAKEVGGSRVEVASLMPEDKDLHSYTPRVILASLIGAADLLLYEGLGVESSWLPVLVGVSGNKAIAPGSLGLPCIRRSVFTRR